MTEIPALLGGAPVRTAPFPTWPPIAPDVTDAVARVAGSAVWSAVDGPEKRRFEHDFAGFHGATHGLAVCNGTIALEIALKALGIGSGDEVIVPAYTFLATATAVLSVSALPVFADIDPKTGCLDPDATEAAITTRTRAVIPVHLAGHPADLDRLVPLAAKYDLAIVEDAAHAHGAQWLDRRVGSFGAFGCWSFQASKNMTAGEGGLLATTDDTLAERAWSLHHCGRSRTGAWYEHGMLGGNYRLTEFQCAVLSVQLAGLPGQLDRRERSAAMLTDGLAGMDGVTPVARDPRCTTHAYHLYQLRYDADGFGGLPRDTFVAAMRAEGVPIGRGYGKPLDQQPVFAEHRFDTVATGYDPVRPSTKYGKADLPATRAFCDDVLWLPQQLLLGSDADMADVVTAASKVRDAAGRLASTA